MDTTDASDDDDRLQPMPESTGGGLGTRPSLCDIGRKLSTRDRKFLDAVVKHRSTTGAGRVRWTGVVEATQMRSPQVARDYWRKPLEPRIRCLVRAMKKRVRMKVAASAVVTSSRYSRRPFAHLTNFRHNPA